MRTPESFSDTVSESADRGRLMNKVPEVTLAFWLVKILSTTVGETGADYLAVHVGLGTVITGLLMGGLLATALVMQLRSRRYVPSIYWLTVVLVSIVGTQVTDALTDGLGVSLYPSSFVVVRAWSLSPRPASMSL